MDYFVYRREYKPEEWPSCEDKSSWTRANIFIFECPDCGERIWGAWEYPSYLSENAANDCFTKGFKEMLRSNDGAKVSPSDYPLYRRIETYGNEAKKFIELDKCPMCGAKLEKNRLHFHGHLYVELAWRVKREFKYNAIGTVSYSVEYIAFSSIERALSHYRKNLPSSSKYRGDKKHKKFLEQCSHECLTMAAEQTKKCAIDNIEQLTDFLKHLISIEKNIYSVSGRLKDLYRLEYEYDVCAKESVYNLLSEKERKVTDAYEAWEAKQTENPEQSVSVPKYNGTYPTEPIKPKAPNAPILEKPGLFNKKRILAENAILTEQYEKKQAQYKKDLDAYNEELAAYKQKIAQIQDEQEKTRTELVSLAKLVHIKECEELQNNYFAAQQEYDQLNSSFDEVSTPQVAALKCLQEEIAQAEELLLSLHQGKQKAYNTGIIFAKYNDFVAIASFYEYLSSGRCTSLDGPHGAYNLYESEIRMNAIVSQLADVIKSLKQIQKNQFVIYTAINEATTELAALNQTTRRINTTLNTMHEELTNINRNTEVTAFYAKKNAELMDTLCFISALN